MTKRRGSKKTTVAARLKDWCGRDVIVPISVVKIHLLRGHIDSHQYFETLKERFEKPDKVIRRTKRREYEVVINLEGREHKFLVVFVKYGLIWKPFHGKNNFVATFYGANQVRKGKVIWPEKNKS